MENLKKQNYKAFFHSPNIPSKGKAVFSPFCVDKALLWCYNVNGILNLWENFMIPLTLSASLLALLGGGIVRKYFMSKDASNAATYLFNAAGSVISAAVIFAWGGITSVSLFTLLLGIAFGLVTAVQAITHLKALEIGPMSYTQVIISFSTLISAMSGAIFWNETIEWAHWVGIALMLVSFVLAVERKNDEKGVSLRWLAVSLISFLFNGGIGLMQKLHQSSDFKGELNEFLVLAFCVSFIFSLALWFFARRKPSAECRVTDSAANGKKKTALFVFLVLSLLNGSTVAVNHKLNLYLSGVMPAAVFFPIINGGGLMITTLAAVIIFKERLSFKQWIGVLVGTTSVIFLCNPF